jgi:integral membrane protein
MASALRRVIWTGRLEALSFLVLVAVAMPLKYLADEPGAVRVVGMAHGVLFLAYVLALVGAASAHRWPIRRTALGVLASLVPIGPLWFERHLRSRR